MKPVQSLLYDENGERIKIPYLERFTSKSQSTAVFYISERSSRKKSTDQNFTSIAPISVKMLGATPSRIANPLATDDVSFEYI